MSHTQPGSGLQSLNSAPGMSGGACSAQIWVQDVPLELAGGSQCHPLMELRLWWFRSDCSFSPSFREGGERERRKKRKKNNPNDFPSVCGQCSECSPGSVLDLLLHFSRETALPLLWRPNGPTLTDKGTWSSPRIRDSREKTQNPPETPMFVD